MILYTGYDSGAPVASGQPGYPEAMFEKLQEILYACLVTGYGSKPGAGWERTHYIQGQTFSFRPPSQDFVITFVNITNTTDPYTYYRVFMSESVTTYPTGGGGSTRPIGNNVRSGYYSADTNPSGATMGEYCSLKYRFYWGVVADADSFAFHNGGWNDASTSYASSGVMSYLYVGKVKSTIGMTGISNAIMAGLVNGMGGVGSPTTNGETQAWTLGYTASRNPFTGLIEQGGGNRGYTSPYSLEGTQGMWNGIPAFTQPPPAEIELTKVPISYGAQGYFGTLRGIACCPAWLGYYGCAHGTQALGLVDQFPAPADVWQRYGKPVRLPDGYDYMMCGIAGWPSLLTNNPSFA